jgi:hypothetical protein
MPGALVYALPEVTAAFPLFWPAVGAVLVVYAITIIFRNPLVHALEAIPVIGGAAATAVARAANWAISYVQGWADTLVWPLIQLLTAPAAAITALAGATVGTAEYLMDRVRITAQMANAEFGRVADSLGQLFSKSAYLLSNLAWAISHLYAAESAITALRNLEVPRAKSQAISSANAYTQGQVHAEAIARSTSVAQVRAETLALHRQELLARQQADQQAAAAAAASAAALATAITAAQVKGQNYTDVKVDEAAAAAAAAIAAALAAAKATARAEAKTVADELAQVRLDCIDPLCGAFGPAVGLWNQLAQGAELLLILGLVQSAVSNPQGSAQAMAGVADGAHNLAAGLLAPFIGRA